MRVDEVVYLDSARDFKPTSDRDVPLLNLSSCILSLHVSGCYEFGKLNWLMGR